jgi:hypothetical protein
MLESPLVGQTTRAVDRARAVQEATDGTACPERETEPTEVDFTAAVSGCKASTGMFPSADAPIAKSSVPSVVHHRPE